MSSRSGDIGYCVLYFIVLKGLYRTVVRTALVYGAETWVTIKCQENGGETSQDADVCSH